MHPVEQWIWFPKEGDAHRQTTCFHMQMKNAGAHRNYRVAELERSCLFPKPIREVSLRFSGDTAVSLWCCGHFLGRGPASSGGDFLEPYNDQPLLQHYATKMTLTGKEIPELSLGQLEFRAVVRMTPVRLFEYSKGHGGFFLTAHILFADGTKTLLLTDESWTIRLLTAYVDEGQFDNAQPEDTPSPAAVIPNLWHCQDAPIPPCAEERLDLGQVTVPAGERVCISLPLDRIYAGYPVVRAKTGGELEVTLRCREWKEEGRRICCRFVKDGAFEALALCSAGEITLEAENRGSEPVAVEVGFITSCYPVTLQAKTVTSDPDLNLVEEVCAHTLKYCRQTLHLDSPTHCELLACTGDYYIEALMTAFTYGDQGLSAFDLRRTADLLRCRDGRMFHTTYSLIWVQMLWDVYRFTGEGALLADCEDALGLLLRRFETYLGDNGLIETPPDFMFVDWLFPDGISTHHPPKALGQTCLNLFYFGALKTAARIYETLGEPAAADASEKEAQKLKAAILKHLYDRERGLFFEGLNTPTPEHLVRHYMPRNVNKRYYRKHANILAAYFGLLDQEDCKKLLERVMEDDTLGQVQPYFTHFLLEAIYRCGLRDVYTLSVLEQWKAPVLECPKGLAEGFYKPEPTYSFDHSHAWGGTPAWSLPLALSGLEILEPGMKKIRLNPSLLGLSAADVQIPTPYGLAELKLRAGKESEITVPAGVELVME